MKKFLISLSNMKKLWPYAKDHRKEIIIDVTGMFFLSMIGLIFPILSAKIIIDLTNKDFKSLILYALIIFVLETIRNALSIVCTKSYAILYHNTCNNLRIDILKKALTLETFEIDNNSSGVFIDRITKDAGNIPNVLDQMERIVFDFIVNFGILITIFVINKILFIYIIISVTVIFIIDKKSINKRYAINKERRKIDEKVTSLIGESVRGIRDIKVLNADSRILAKSKEELVNSMNKSFEMNKINYIYQWISGTVKDFYQLFLIIIGVYLINKNLIAIPSFIIIYMYKDRIQDLLNGSIRIAESLKEFNLSFERVYEILEGDKFKREKYGNIDLEKLEGHLEFKNLSFAYKDKKTLEDVSFKVKPNQIVAFVGKTGSGKSTIFSLVNKLYNVEDNMLFLDGYDINTLNKNSIRNNIALITQNPYLFNFSIMDNLKIVKGDASLEEIKEVCKESCIDEFIESLPDKYDTIIGENGVMLSGGQKQRLSIARALLKKSEIILFDEATSALDNKTQNEIKQVINNIKGEKTVLIIAHRLSTIIDADKIFVIDEGKIVGEGTHKELFKKNDFYKNLYEKYE